MKWRRDCSVYERTEIVEDFNLNMECHQIVLLRKSQFFKNVTSSLLLLFVYVLFVESVLILLMNTRPGWFHRLDEVSLCRTSLIGHS